MPKLEITDKHCKAKAPPSGQLEYTDTLVKGLVLRIQPGRDTRTFRFHYRWQGKRAFRSLGHYPDMTLSAAREAAKACRVQLAAGLDPGAPAPALQMTLGDLIESFLTRHMVTKRSVKEVRRRLTKNVTEIIGAIKLSDLHRRDITRAIDAVKDRGAATESVRTFQDLRAACRWAVARGDLDRSPMEGMRLPAELKPRERVLSAEEIALMWQRLDTAPMSPPARAAIRLALACGQRIGEVTGMARAELDLEQALWHLPSSRTKNQRPHSVPLNRIALGIIRDQLQPGAEFVFMWRGAMLKAAGVPHALQRGAQGRTTLGLSSFSPHDLRRTFVTHLIEMGITPAVIEALVNHVSGARGTVLGKHYNMHSYAAEKRTAMDLWGERLEQIIGTAG